MTLFQANSMGTVTITCATTATDSLCDAIKEEDPALTSTAVGLSTTLAVYGQENIKIESDRYVQSLSDSQISRCVEMIDERLNSEDALEKELIAKGLLPEDSKISFQEKQI